MLYKVITAAVLAASAFATTETDASMYLSSGYESPVVDKDPIALSYYYYDYYYGQSY